MKKVGVNIAEAKRSFSDLLDRVAYGKETITISRRGKPMARLVPVGPEGGRPHPADARGWLADGDDFFATINTIVANHRKHIPRTLRRRK